MLKSKKGFSLVELIVVIAIMAVLVGVLAPTLIGYVEKSRAQRDASNLEELRHQVELAIADEEVYQELNFNGDEAVYVFKIVNKVLKIDTAFTTAESTEDRTKSNFELALSGKVGDEIDLTSKKYGKDGTYTITIAYNSDTENVKVDGEYAASTNEG